MNTRTLVAGAVLAGLLAAPVAAGADTIRLQSTFDISDAGLYDQIKSQFEAANPGDKVMETFNGSGKAIDQAKLGLADVIVVHSPNAEQTNFVAPGFAKDNRRYALFYSDYVILGPPSDPAGVAAKHPHDAAGAFEDVAAAGGAGKAHFLSRSDNSGTNVEEEQIWKFASKNAPPSGQAAGAVNTQASTTATPAPATQAEPCDASKDCTTPAAANFPSWYLPTKTGQADNVQQTAACAASPGAPDCYTITDRGTYNNLVNKGTLSPSTLKVLADTNANSARGGQSLLLNRFSAYIVKKDAPFASAPTNPPNEAAAQRFVDFLTSPGFQAYVNTYPSAAQPAFFADAYPQVGGTPPTTATAGSQVPITLTLTDRFPFVGAVSGYPVQLQQSTDNGATYTNVGDPVATGADGTAGFGPTISATTRYRVSLPRFGAFSPSTQDVGTVAVPSPVGVAPPGPQPKPVLKDTTKPTVSKVKLTSRKLTLRLSEAGTVKVSIRRAKVKRVKGRKRTTYATVKTVTLKASKAGSVSRKVSKLKRGSYRLTLSATDVAGNRAKAKVVKLSLK